MHLTTIFFLQKGVLILGQFEFYHDILAAGQCQLYDEYNKCCMLQRIEIIVTYPWERNGEEYV